MTDCDTEDLMCQMTALSHLKGLKDVLGGERYREEFPELQGLDDKIASREASLRTTLEGCLSKSLDSEANVGQATTFVLTGKELE